jgi:hypothetical protein
MDLRHLPNELLLGIAKRVRNNDSLRDAYWDLRHLALSCRELRPIAQEALLEHVNLEIEIPADAGTERPSYIVQFLCLLLSRQGLARKVKTLRLHAYTHSHDFAESCAGTVPYHMGDYQSSYDWCEVIRANEDFVRSKRLPNGSALHNAIWIKAIRRAWEPALAGILLACTPAVDTLNIQSYCDAENWGATMPKNLSDWFGTLADHRDFDLTAIPGLSNVRKLHSDRLLPS